MCTIVIELISCEVFSATNIKDLSNILKVSQNLPEKMLRLRYKSNTQDISFRVLLVFKVFQSVLSDSADIFLHTEYKS